MAPLPDSDAKRSAALIRMVILLTLLLRPAPGSGKGNEPGMLEEPAPRVRISPHRFESRDRGFDQEDAPVRGVRTGV